MTTSLLAKPIEEYAALYTTEESEPLAALNRETNLKRGDAIMISGHLQGAVLKMFSAMIRPRCVLEIGTFTGYSAICLAEGLTGDGHLHTIEIDEELKDIAAKYIEQSGLSSKITLHTGAAASIIPAIDSEFDLVFIDADKINYELYFDLVIDKVPIGGFIIADNVLYDGEVVLSEDKQTKNAKAINSFNKKIKATDRIEHLLLPVRDGLMIVRKIK